MSAGSVATRIVGLLRLARWRLWVVLHNSIGFVLIAWTLLQSRVWCLRGMPAPDGVMTPRTVVRKLVVAAQHCWQARNPRDHYLDPDHDLPADEALEIAFALERARDPALPRPVLDPFSAREGHGSV